MHPADFKVSDTGKVVKIPEDCHAFIPAPLPPRRGRRQGLLRGAQHANIGQ
jgi:hypothetical protein